MTSSRTPLRAAFAAIFTLLTFYLLLASNAFAAGGGAERVGKNLGDLIGSFGQYVTLSAAGIVALMMVLARKFSGIGALLIMVFLVMSLFVSGDEWTRLIKNTMDVLSRGV